MFVTDFICPVLLVIACVAIIGVTLYGFYIQNEVVNIVGAIGTVCLILFIGLFIGISLGVKTTENNESIQANEAVQEEVKSQPVQVISEITYEPAELVECVELESGVYQMLFVVGESEAQLFSWIDTYTYPDDTPYLLTMDNKGTLNDPLDDEILVVWKDMN